jgi:hypothetical protein
MQIAEPIINRKYFISTAIRLEKILTRNEKFKMTALFKDTNNNKSPYFHQSKRRFQNHFANQKQLAPARINYNNATDGNTSDRQ